LGSHDSLSQPYPRSRASRERLWHLASGVEVLEIRRYAFTFWEHHVATDDLLYLRSVDPSDELWDAALRCRLKLRDASAAPFLVDSLRADPAGWAGYVPAVYREPGTVDALIDVLDDALSDWFRRNDTIFLHLPGEEVARVVRARREVLLSHRNTWNALWRSDDASAQALVREAIQRANNDWTDPHAENEAKSDLRHFFFAGSGGIFPYPVTYSMLEAIRPVLGAISPKERRHLAQLAVGSGFDTWVWQHLRSDVPEWLRQRVWPFAAEVLAALDEAASAVSLGSRSPYNVPEFVQVLSMSQTHVDVKGLVRDWLGSTPATDRLVVAGIMLDRFGTSRDLAWWEDVIHDEPFQAQIWSAVRFTLSRRKWHA
jgi:hypothetical protein